jgi:RNA polymerase sigma-70 factor, ECF subfamily
MVIEKNTKDWLTREVLIHANGLKRFALSLCQNESESEDLVAETVLKAFENFRRLKDGSRVKQWLFRILNNQFISNYRNKKKHIKISFSGEANIDSHRTFSLFEEMSSRLVDTGNPERKFIAKITNEQIQKAINTLTEEFRTALVLCDMEDFSYMEIAVILSLPVGTVRSRISRARINLQKKLWIYAKELGIGKSRPTRIKNKNTCTCGNEEEIKEATYNSD